MSMNIEEADSEQDTGYSEQRTGNSVREEGVRCQVQRRADFNHEIREKG
jgi:hypothetical protein